MIENLMISVLKELKFRKARHVSTTVYHLTQNTARSINQYIDRVILKKLRVLHITPWYPTEEDPGFAIWIKRHIETLAPFCESTVLNFRVRSGSEPDIHVVEEKLHQHVTSTKTTRWIFKELMHFRMLRKMLSGDLSPKNFDVINFHIAYPNLIFAKWISSLKNSKVVITEHWSYYHFHFYSAKKLTRVKNIFKRGTPLIAVSKALHKDIETFAGVELPQNIVPNAVDTKSFKPMEAGERAKALLLGGYWKSPKRPFMFLDVVEEFLAENRDWSVRIFGHGPMAAALEIWCEEHGQTWIGRLTADGIAAELVQCYGFVMPSDYETFSVACAESLCCGTPVLASRVGAIPELINDENGLLVDKEEDWEAQLAKFLQKSWNHRAISDDAIAKYSYAAVGMAYHDILKRL